MAKCLVLGANGLLGSVLVRDLSAKKHQVIAFDRFSEKHFNFTINENVSVLKGDFMNLADLNHSLKDVDYVFHFISTSNPIVTENNPLLDIETNLLMSIKLFELCVKNNIKRIIYPSSGGAIYGLNQQSVIKGYYNENDLPLPVSPYAIGKLSIESYLRYFKIKHKLDYIVYRISNPYGPNQSRASLQGVIPIFIEKLINNEPITVYGDGSMIRDYIYVDDVAKMIVNSFESKHKHDLYNIGSGNGTTINSIIKNIEIIMHKRAIIRYLDKPSTFVDKVVLDTSRFISEHEIKPEFNLKKGIRAVINARNRN